MNQAKPNDPVTVLIAYRDRSRRCPMGPALILFGPQGAASAAVLVERPWHEEREGHHGPPADFVARFATRRSALRGSASEWSSLGHAGR
jgi:hypothetical protein